jgi:uncharacterized protein (TIGR00661 family)
MKILYGIQTTGNGHISRSREVIQQLREQGHQVQTILSGNDPYRLADVGVFKPAVLFRGLTFSTYRGKIRYLKTAANLNFLQFFSDIRSFDASAYDLVINDFEPVSARIARRFGLPSIGIGHQYAFAHKIPTAGDTVLSRWIINHFAPTDHPLGLHWHHFGHPILPPIVPSHLETGRSEVDKKILVYLPFEHLPDIWHFLDPLADWHFYIYGPVEQEEDRGHLHLRTFSRSGFLNDLVECTGVVCNAGFELASEALHIGKRLLVKPLSGQMEQVSNALAIERLGLGTVMPYLDSRILTDWLDSAPPAALGYPNVARLIAEWIGRGIWQDVMGLARDAWSRLQNQAFDVSFNRNAKLTGGAYTGRT